MSSRYSYVSNKVRCVGAQQLRNGHLKNSRGYDFLCILHFTTKAYRLGGSFFIDVANSLSLKHSKPYVEDRKSLSNPDVVCLKTDDCKQNTCRDGWRRRGWTWMATLWSHNIQRCRAEVPTKNWNRSPRSNFWNSGWIENRYLRSNGCW